MKRSKSVSRLQAALAMICIFVMLFSLCACSKGADNSSTSGETVTITVDVVDDKEETETFTISTESENLRGALEQENLIEGEESEYGLMVITVNGLRADYDEDGAYWAFYQDGEYLQTGVDTTEIADGDHYEIVYTAA